MTQLPNIQFQLPTLFEWSIVSLVITVALFYQFQRVLLLRNWDLIGLFFFVPGLWLIEYSHSQDQFKPGQNLRWSSIGYSWLLGVSALWFLRCFFDGSFAKRPRVSANLRTIPLYWLIACLLIGHSVAVVSKSPNSSDLIGRKPAVLNGVENSATAVVVQTDTTGDLNTTSTKPWVTIAIALICQMIISVLLFLIPAIHFQDRSTGATAAVTYLLLPYTGIYYDQSHHVWPTMWILAAFLSYRRPFGAGLCLGMAIGTSFFPVFLLPIWLQFYHARGIYAFISGVGITGLIGLIVSILCLAMAGELTLGLWQTIHLEDWLPWGQTRAESLWMGSFAPYRLPMFCFYLTLVISSIYWPHVRNLGQLLALSTALLLGIQFWFADHGGVYVLWYLPCLLLMILRPTTLDLQPPVSADTLPLKWLRRLTQRGKNRQIGMPNTSLAA